MQPDRLCVDFPQPDWLPQTLKVCMRHVDMPWQLTSYVIGKQLPCCMANDGSAMPQLASLPRSRLRSKLFKKILTYLVAPGFFTLTDDIYSDACQPS
jgi:hypothetical protein